MFIGRVSSANQFRQCKYLPPLKYFLHFIFICFIIVGFIQIKKHVGFSIIIVHTPCWPAGCPRYLYTVNHMPELGELEIYRQLIEIYYYITTWCVHMVINHQIVEFFTKRVINLVFRLHLFELNLCIYMYI